MVSVSLLLLLLLLLLLTVGDGFSELQQGAEGQRGDVGSPPALRLLLHLLLKLDPSSRLPPLQLLVPVDHQLVQLHKHLQHSESQSDELTPTSDCNWNLHHHQGLLLTLSNVGLFFDMNSLSLLFELFYFTCLN